MANILFAILFLVTPVFPALNHVSMPKAVVKKESILTLEKSNKTAQIQPRFKSTLAARSSLKAKQAKLKIIKTTSVKKVGMVSAYVATRENSNYKFAEVLQRNTDNFNSSSRVLGAWTVRN